MIKNKRNVIKNIAMLTNKHLEINQILALNNPWGVDDVKQVNQIKPAVLCLKNEIVLHPVCGNEANFNLKTTIGEMHV